MYIYIYIYKIYIHINRHNMVCILLAKNPFVFPNPGKKSSLVLLNPTVHGGSEVALKHEEGVNLPPPLPIAKI